MRDRSAAVYTPVIDEFAIPPVWFDKMSVEEIVRLIEDCRTAKAEYINRVAEYEKSHDR